MKNQKTMKDLPVSERPYERCESQGPDKLSDKELLTVIIRSGTKQDRADEIALRLIESCGTNGISALCQKSLSELKKIQGIGKVKAIQLACICELSQRIASGKRLFGTRFQSPKKIAEYYSVRMKHQQRECLQLLILDSKNRILSEETVSVGTINLSIADPREIYRTALKHNGVSIVLLHNHPSGDPSPSSEDVSSTERILKAGKLIGISLLDHIIIGTHGYVSLREEGYLNFLG